MVRLTTWLSRVPVIKFRKGGAGKPGGPPVSAKPAGSCPMGALRPAAASQSPPAAAMSTGAAIPDIDLPARYRRTPLSDEEIDHINGGGIHDPRKSKSSQPDPQMIGVIKIPKGILIKSGSKRNEVVSLNLVLQKGSQQKN